VTPLEALAREEVGGLALEVARITGLVIVSPVLWSNAPKTVRAAIVVILSILAHGHGSVAPEIVGSPGLVAFAVVSELMLGAAMGFVVRLAIAAAEIAANAIAPMIGFGIAHVFDPTQGGGNETVLAVMFRLLALWVALLTGVHHVIIGSLLASFRTVPVGSLLATSELFPLLLHASEAALVTGVRLALPLLAVLFMVQIALGFVSRAAPAMQIFSFAFTLVVGGLVLIASLPDIGREMAIELTQLGPRIEGVLEVASGR
jgi:flagellar biosynthetic protein FliR